MLVCGGKKMTLKNQLKIAIAIPTYNGSKVIQETLESIYSQGFKNYQIFISDDFSSDDTVKIIQKVNKKHGRIKIFINQKNIGYGPNLQELNKYVDGDILFLMGQDDILLKDALQKTHDAFKLNPNIGAVTRPYFWFDTIPNEPVRAITPLNPLENSIISINDGKREAKKVFESIGQLSGLALRRKYMEIDFHHETFPAHIYPFAQISKIYKIVYLKDYTVAVRIESSQTRFKHSIYEISPTESWVKMFRHIYKSPKYKTALESGIEQISKNFIGLLQLKNYSTFSNLIREIKILIKLNPRNLIDLRFWFFSFGSVLTPRKILIYLVDNYKRKIGSRSLKGLKKNIKYK